MNSLVSRLVEVINKESKCLESFLTLLSEEQKFLVENDVDSLRGSMKDQEKTIRATRKLEDERIRLTDLLSEKLKVNKEEVNISKLIELVEESYSTKLRELQSTLSSLYAKLERQRRKNEFLIKQSMKYVDKGIGVFLGLERKKSDHFFPQWKDKKAYFEKGKSPCGLRFSASKSNI